MNNNNLITFLFGAVVGGAAAYYIFKHQDEILEKIQEIEGNLNIDHAEWIEKAKAQLERLTQSFQTTVQKYSHSESDEAAKESEVAHIIAELNQLRQEVNSLSPQS